MKSICSFNLNLKKLGFFLIVLFLAFDSNSQCVANFTYSYTPGGGVSFSNTSTYTPGITSFTWSYGDGNTGMQVSPSHTYVANGTYTVFLALSTVTPPFCSSSFSAVVTITNSPCNNQINASFTGTLGLNGTYSVTSTSTGTTPAATYSWNWGDNTGATGASAVHTYSANGWKTVVLQLTDGACYDTAYSSIYVSNVGCSLTASFNYTLGNNGLVNFQSTSTGTVPQTTYSWTFGDGGTGTGISPNHVYQSNGVYTASLYISNPNGTMVPTCFSSTTTTISIINATCNLNASFTFTAGPSGSYSVTSTSTGTTPSATYSWSWGDGGSSTGPNASHTYTNNGAYPIKLKVYDACNDSTVQWVNINNVCVLTSSFSSNVFQNGLTNFMSLAQGTNGSCTYSWSFGDGGTATGPFAQHQYLATGSYTVTFTVTNPTFVPVCSSTSTAVITITCALISNFSYTVNPGGLVNFASTSTGTIPASSYTWNYGDGNTGTGITSSHTYSNGGVHQVNLLVNNAGACSDSLTQNVNVNTIPCTANSNFTAVSSGWPLYWYATPAYGGNVVNAIWYWGDGSSTNALYPSHSYSTAGLYNICLSVTVSCAQTSSTCSNYNIFRTYSGAAAMATINVVPSIPTSIRQLQMNETANFMVYPNPNNGKFVISIDKMEASKSMEILVFDLLGREVYRSEAEVPNGMYHGSHDLNYLPSGSYIVKLKTENGSVQKKMLIQH